MKMFWLLIALSAFTLQAKEPVDLKTFVSQVEEEIAPYAKGNEKVKATMQAFAKHLNDVYVAGEGFIAPDVIRILEAARFAAEKHQNQVRKGKEKIPYIIHPIGVADHLLMVGKVRDADILIAALLHDTVEDTDTTFLEIQERFGTRVESFVREVTDDKTLPQKERKRLQIEHAPDKSSGAAQIKLADKWYNLNDMLNAPPELWGKGRVDAYFKWAKKVVDALPWVNAPLFKAVEEVIQKHCTEEGSNL